MEITTGQGYCDKCGKLFRHVIMIVANGECLAFCNDCTVEVIKELKDVHEKRDSN